MHLPKNHPQTVISIHLVTGVTTKTNNHVVTDSHLYRDHYDIQAHERELIKQRWSELPADQKAVMTVNEAAAYLGVSRVCMFKWHKRGVLPAIVNEKNGYKSYLLGHLWVFKVLLLEREDDEKTAT